MPDFFTLDDDDRSRPRAANTPPLPELVEAAELCPTGAITVVDAETGEPQFG